MTRDGHVRTGLHARSLVKAELDALTDANAGSYDVDYDLYSSAGSGHVCIAYAEDVNQERAHQVAAALSAKYSVKVWEHYWASTKGRHETLLFVRFGELEYGGNTKPFSVVADWQHPLATPGQYSDPMLYLPKTHAEGWNHRPVIAKRQACDAGAEQLSADIGLEDMDDIELDISDLESESNDEDYSRAVADASDWFQTGRGYLENALEDLKHLNRCLPDDAKLDVVQQYRFAEKLVNELVELEGAPAFSNDSILSVRCSVDDVETWNVALPPDSALKSAIRDLKQHKRRLNEHSKAEALRHLEETKQMVSEIVSL